MLKAIAEQITANAIVGDDWAQVGFAYADKAGNDGSFDFDNTLSCTADDISDAL